MKKTAAILVLLILLCQTVCLAEDTGIQIISGPEQEVQTVNMDDWKVDQTAVISGFAEITLRDAAVVDGIENSDTRNSYSWRGFSSGNEAEYLSLIVDVLNTQTNPVDFLKLIDNGICTFERDGQEYQFGMWYRQYDAYDGFPYVKKDDGFAIEPMYRGKYIIVATLPNDVISSKDPLSITFKIGENEFTYNHRK